MKGNDLWVAGDWCEMKWGDIKYCLRWSTATWSHHISFCPNLLISLQNISSHLTPSGTCPPLLPLPVRRGPGQGQGQGQALTQVQAFLVRNQSILGILAMSKKSSASATLLTDEVIEKMSVWLSDLNWWNCPPSCYELPTLLSTPPMTKANMLLNFSFHQIFLSDIY